MKSKRTFTKGSVLLLGLLALAQGCLQPKKTPVTTTEQTAPAQADVPDATDEIYAEHVRTTAYQTPEEERLSFVLPPGFEATLFASEPDITKPINMAFDEKGRLWVTQSSEYPIAAGPSEGNDRITILEDTDGDGRADKISDFANELNIPIGIMPIKGGAIAYSIPNIYRFTDSDNDGKADKREVMLGEFGHKDTHGMINNLMMGFDGWMHASHGYANTSVVAGTDGDSVRMYSGNTFRFKLDGSRVEKTTDGRINPFGSDYDEMGYHYSADCHTLPIYQLIWGGNYEQWGKKVPNMGFAPTMMDYGLNSTALSGLVYYTDNQFPAEYQNSFYSGDVVTCRISRNVIEFNGSTPKATRKEDFLVSRDPWFRPVDIKIGPDGAMYIADFYNRIIGHYEVPLSHPGRDRISGRIWKITYKGNNRKAIDWSKANQSKLVDGLNHDVLGIRMAATDELVARFGSKAVGSLKKVVRKKNSDPKQLIQAIWALHRLSALPDDVLTAAMELADVRVNVHAYKVLANYEKLTDDQRSLAMQGLRNQNPHIQRAAAELLSRHPSPQSYRQLITLHSRVPDYDTHLRYTVLLSIQKHLEQDAIVKQVVTEQWNEQEAGVIALVASDMESEPAGKFLFEYLQRYPQPKERMLAYMESIGRSIPEAEVEQVVSFVKSKTANDLDQQYRLAMAISQGMDQRGGRPTPVLQEWYVGLATNFLKNMPQKAEEWSEEVKSQQRYAAEVVGQYKVEPLEPALKQLLTYKNADEDTRGAAAGALMAMAPERNAPLVSKALSSGEESLAVRQKFARALGQSELPQVREMLGQVLKIAPPEVQETVASILASNAEGKTQLLKFIRQGAAPARLLKARAVEEPFLANIEPKQLEEYKELTANIQPISEERQKLIEERLASFNPKGKTPVAGKAVYAKNCSMCHQIDKQGGLIGPQLDGIGNWGRTALTTKILDPNRNISEDFRLYNISLKNGKTVSGLYRREEGQLLVLANQTGQEFTLPQQDIKERVASKYTLMPDHFNSTIPKEDFDALLVYLLSVK